MAGGGEMGALMRAHDWSQSSLGPPAGWPQALRTAVRLMLNTGHPMYIWWGPSLACLYNDAYRQSIGPERHPGSLGRPAREVWEEIWPIIGPQIEQVRSGGGPTWHEDQLVPITRHGRREDVYWTYSYSPIDDEGAPNGIGGVLVICTETTRKILAERAQARAKERQHRQFAQAPGFVIVMSGPDHVVDFVNAAHRALFGSAAWEGQPIRAAFPGIQGQDFFDQLDNVYRTGETFIARSVPVRFRRTPDGEPETRHLSFTYAPIFDDDGSVAGIFCEGIDVTEQELLESQRRLLVGELEHRMKNVMAIVSAIVRQSFRNAASLETVRDSIVDRIAVLGRAHDLLTRSRWTSASMGGLVEGALAAHRAGAGERFRVNGPEVVLAPSPALSLALVINELATNAVKYGALSGNDGHVEVTWTVDRSGPEPMFRFDWREVGGPPVTAPERNGFGLSLIRGSLGEGFSDRSGIKFEVGGVHFIAEASLQQLAAADTDPGGRAP
jgi:two-component sensor histidine kinase